eukprot:INCI16449.1.p1 GENE.INCI16449.1~~INCI16449.1.p1  ORF type:complete len:320 (+),score=47.67 INCI16449.1:116-1075(+)
MSFLEQNRLRVYKRQLVSIQARLQRYATPGKAPNVDVWKHTFDESDSESDGDHVNHSDDQVSRTHENFDEAELLHLESVNLDEEHDSFAENVTVVADRASGTFSAGNADDGIHCEAADTGSIQNFDYIEDAEPSFVSDVVEDGNVAVSCDASVASTAASIVSKESTAQDTASTSSTAISRGGQRVPRSVRMRKTANQSRRSRFEEPGSVFYKRHDDIWDSVGINHDQMRRPYRQLQFNAKGDYPAERTVPRERPRASPSQSRLTNTTSRLRQKQTDRSSPAGEESALVVRSSVPSLARRRPRFDKRTTLVSRGQFSRIR